MPETDRSQSASSEANAAEVANRFRSLAAQWVAERPRGVDLHWMTNTPAYRAIIALGPPAVPLILAELRREVDHWFPALSAITGVDPVPPEARGKIKLMAAAWLHWGEAPDDAAQTGALRSANDGK